MGHEEVGDSQVSFEQLGGLAESGDPFRPNGNKSVVAKPQPIARTHRGGVQLHRGNSSVFWDYQPEADQAGQVLQVPGRRADGSGDVGMEAD